MQKPATSATHPKGLYVLFATEMWERFNYYGMRSILVLFMVNALIFKSDFASNLYGSYISLLYLTPLIGGYIADRYWGNKRSILVGGLVMATGEGILFICASIYNTQPDLGNILFFSGLGFMIAGNGFFKPNISSLVGQLYPKGDPRIDPAYTIFYMGINIGAAAGPILCGYVGDTGNPSDFKWAFLVGGIGMIVSVIIQKLYHDKYVLSPKGHILGLTPGTNSALEMELATDKGTVVKNNTEIQPAKEIDIVDTHLHHRMPSPPKLWLNPLFIVIGMLAFAALAIGAIYLDTRINYLFYLLIASFICIIGLIFSDKNLTLEERKRVTVLVIIAFFVVFFWAAYEQTGASLTLFANQQTNRNLWSGYTMPTSYFQSFNAVFIIIFAPILAFIWLRLGRKQPSTPSKMGIGLLLLALGYLWIAFGVKDVNTLNKVSIIWLTGMYLFHTLGELCLSPIGLSLFNKLAPLKFASLLMAVWFLGNAGGNKLAGVLSALYPENGKTTSFLGYQMTNLYDFFMLFVVMAGIAGVILLLLAKPLQKMMGGIK